jgi:alpha-tubulin suppressor-like RCC1 family protein
MSMGVSLCIFAVQQRTTTNLDEIHQTFCLIFRQSPISSHFSLAVQVVRRWPPNLDLTSVDMADNSTNGASKRPMGDGDEENGQAKKAKGESAFKGVVLFSGATDFSEVGRKSSLLPRSPQTQWKPVRLAALQDKDMAGVFSGPTSVHMLAVTADGELYSWGRNEKGQLGLGHAVDKRCPSLVTALKDKHVVSAATGRNHSLVLTDKGEVYAFGDNRSGQCAGDKNEMTVTTPKLVTYDGPPATRVACGAEFSALVDVQGNLWTWGHPEHGQLGHNTEGSFLEKAGKVNFEFVYNPTRVVLFVDKDPKNKNAIPVLNVTIREVACGANHCVAVDDKKRAFSWGFGGYGRLGHSETNNELVPRLIRFFDGPRRGVIGVAAGGQFNLAQVCHAKLCK